jgi:hypothetical protein
MADVSLIFGEDQVLARTAGTRHNAIRAKCIANDLSPLIDELPVSGQYSGVAVRRDLLESLITA